MAALKEQVAGVLPRALPIKGIKLLYFEAGDLRNAFGAPLLFTPEHIGAVSPTGEAMVL